MGFRENFCKWWADDWHAFPRFCRDLYLWFKGPQWARVGLWTISYNPDTEEQQMDFVKVSRKDLPHEAVHVTGKGWRTYAVDLDCAGRFPGPGEITAVDLYLFAKTDAFDESSLFTERRGLSIDTKTLGIAVGAIIAIGVFWFLWNGVLQ